MARVSLSALTLHEQHWLAFETTLDAVARIMKIIATLNALRRGF
jgi:hypothetical protein